MGLHPNQEILGAVQLGTCAGINDTNPYQPEDKKKYFGWKQGHERAIENHQEYLRWKNAPWYRKAMCKIGAHKYSLKRIPGRPHIDPKTGNIDGRNPIIKKYTCIYCPDTRFVGLGGYK